MREVEYLHQPNNKEQGQSKEDLLAQFGILKNW